MVSEPPYTVFIGNLPKDAVQGDIEHIFSKLTIKDVRMMYNRETDEFKGFAFVEFNSTVDLKKALELDGAIYDEQYELKINKAEQNRRRFEGRGNSNGYEGRRNSTIYEGRRNSTVYEGRRNSTGYDGRGNITRGRGIQGDRVFYRGGYVRRNNNRGRNQHNGPPVGVIPFNDQIRKNTDRGRGIQGDRIFYRGGYARRNNQGRNQQPQQQQIVPPVDIIPSNDPNRKKLVLVKVNPEERKKLDEEEEKIRREKIFDAKKHEPGKSPDSLKKEDSVSEIRLDN